MALVAKNKVVTVATAGTRVPILSGTDAQHDIVGCVIQAISGTIYVGDNTVDHATNKGHMLKSASNDSLNLMGDNKNTFDLGLLYLDATANGNQANVLYFVRV